MASLAIANGPTATVWLLQLSIWIELKVVIFKHLARVWESIEDLEGEEVKKWKGALEKYVLEQIDGKNILRVNVDRSKDYREMMENGFKKGFEIVKQLAEA